MNSNDAINLYQLLWQQDIPVWLTGGWGIDALLETHTRPHKDLDVLILRDDVTFLCAILAARGYQLKELWSENKWVEDRNGVCIPTAFVLRDKAGRELDVHAMDLDPEGNGIPAWGEAEEFIFTQQELSGRGVIAETEVQCITPDCQVRCHAGYDLPDYQRQDLVLLKRKFEAAGPVDDETFQSDPEIP